MVGASQYLDLFFKGCLQITNTDIDVSINHNTFLKERQKLQFLDNVGQVIRI